MVPNERNTAGICVEKAFRACDVWFFSRVYWTHSTKSKVLVLVDDAYSHMLYTVFFAIPKFDHVS